MGSRSFRDFARVQAVRVLAVALLALSCGSDCDEAHADPNVFKCVDGNVSLWFSSTQRGDETKTLETELKLLPGSNIKIVFDGNSLPPSRILSPEWAVPPVMVHGRVTGPTVVTIYVNMNGVARPREGRYAGVILPCTGNVPRNSLSCWAIGTTAVVTGNICVVESDEE